MGAGAVAVTLGRHSDLPSLGTFDRASYRSDDGPEASSSLVTEAVTHARGGDDADPAPSPDDQEWERELARAMRALAKGRIDRAYEIANQLPEDSVLRRTPEFGEIRYRYVQSYIQEAERALERGDLEQVSTAAERALEVSGITTMQRQEARRLLRRAEAPQDRRIVD